MFVNRINPPIKVVVNQPTSIIAGTPNTEAEKLYNTFGYYMSVPMSQETYNIAMNGKTVMTMRGTNNDAVKLSLANDTWGESYFTSGAHYHKQRSVLKELDDATQNSLNGYASYGAVELHQYVDKDLQITYTRRGEDANTLNEQLVISIIAEVNCVYENDEVRNL